MNYKHNQVKIKYGNRLAEVDEKLADFVIACWKNNISTCMSCQENFPGIVWVYFYDVNDSIKFLNIVAGEYDNDENSLYQRVINSGHENPLFSINRKGSLTKNPKSSSWHYIVGFNDLSVNEEIVDDEVITTAESPADLVISFSVRFPQEDLPIVIERLNNYFLMVLKPGQDESI